MDKIEKGMGKIEEEMVERYIELKKRLKEEGVDFECTSDGLEFVDIRKAPCGTVYVPEVELFTVLRFDDVESIRRVGEELIRLSKVAEKVKDLVKELVSLEKKLTELEERAEQEKERKAKEVFSNWSKVLKKWEFDGKVVELRKGYVGKKIGFPGVSWFPEWYLNGQRFHLSDYITSDGKILSKKAMKNLGLSREHIKALIDARNEFLQVLGLENVYD